MIDKVFEQILPFRAVQTTTGPKALPIITVQLIRGEGKRVTIRMLFDTGASTTVLRRDFAHLLGAKSWTDGEPVSVATAGGTRTAYKFIARLEVLGKAIECPVHLMDLPDNPFYMGLLGREVVFEHFGFGFWESDRQLLVTVNP